jgi:hypothetical protein
LGVGLGVGFTVGLGVGVGLGFDVGLPCECEADDEEPVCDDADVNEGAVNELPAVEPGTLPIDDVPGLEELDELAGGADAVAPTFADGSRSMTAATMSPPSSTNTTVMTTTRSRIEPGSGTAIRSP